MSNVQVLENASPNISSPNCGVVLLLAMLMSLLFFPKKIQRWAVHHLEIMEERLLELHLWLCNFNSTCNKSWHLSSVCVELHFDILGQNSGWGVKLRYLSNLFIVIEFRHYLNCFLKYCRRIKYSLLWIIYIETEVKYMISLTKLSIVKFVAPV